jgi:adenylate cyclase
LAELRGELFEPVVGARGGKVVKRMGDGWIVEFPNISDATASAIEVQEGLSEHAFIRLRIGVHIGDVTFQDEDVYGDGINVAARLEAMAKSGQVLISDTAHQSLDGKAAMQFVGGESHELKNIARPVAVWRWPAASNAMAPASTALALPDKPSIAVLPFDNMSGDPEQEYFSDGISEDIITDLSKISALFVIARNSAFAYKGRAIDVRKAAKEMGVSYILEGSVRRAGNRLRITAQLNEGASARHLWAERYDREMDDIFAIQDEITREVVEALKITLNLDENARLGKAATGNIVAYDIALRGISLMYHHNQQGTFEAQDLFEQAIALDPDYITPHFGLAVVLNTIYVNGWSDAPDDTLQRALEIAQRAVAIDPLDPQGHWALALSQLWRRNLDAAIAASQRAIELGPNYAEAFAIYGYVLSYAGEPAKAIESLRSAMRLDPQYTEMWLHFLGHAQFVIGDYQQAAETLQRRINRNPSTDISRVLLASCLGHLDRVQEARALWAEALEINPDYSIEQKARILPYKNRTDWERFTGGLQKAGVSPI